METKNSNTPKTVAPGDLHRLWLLEVPKIVERNELERLRVRQNLGLVS